MKGSLRSQVTSSSVAESSPALISVNSRALRSGSTCVIRSVPSVVWRDRSPVDARGQETTTIDTLALRNIATQQPAYSPFHSIPCGCTGDQYTSPWCSETIRLHDMRHRHMTFVQCDDNDKMPRWMNMLCRVIPVKTEIRSPVRLCACCS